MKPVPVRAFLTLLAASAVTLPTTGAQAADQDRKFFKSVEGNWAGPGEIVAGKYKGTKFNCTFEGTTPVSTAGMTLDGGCRVGVFTQKMTASIERKASSARAVIGGAGGAAIVATGRERPRAATRTTIPTLATSAARAATERRARSGR